MRLCEMTKNDFKSKQKVYLRAIGDNARWLKDGEEKIVEGFVTRVSDEYIYVKINDPSKPNCKFDHTNRFFERVNIGGAMWELLLDKDQIEEERQAEGYIKKLVEATGKVYYEIVIEIASYH